MNSERICKKRNLLFKCILFIFSFKISVKLVVMILKRVCTFKYLYVLSSTNRISLRSKFLSVSSLLGQISKKKVTFDITTNY